MLTINDNVWHFISWLYVLHSSVKDIICNSSALKCLLEMLYILLSCVLTLSQVFTTMFQPRIIILMANLSEVTRFIWSSVALASTGATGWGGKLANELNIVLNCYFAHKYFCPSHRFFISNGDYWTMRTTAPMISGLLETLSIVSLNGTELNEQYFSLE